VAQTKKIGIEVHGFFIFGSLADSVKSIRNTIQRAAGLNLDYASFNVFVPYPGTESFSRLEKENMLITKDWSRYDQSYGGLVFRHPELNDKDIRDLIRLAYLRFYLNWTFIFNRLRKDFCSINLLKRDVRNIYKIFTNYILRKR
jgi:radical SAM superfamily enzyme YgiQ (UPF0313 family)